MVVPNLRATEAAGRLIRIQSSGGIEDLEAGESREAVYELRPRFPQLLGLGEFEFTYRLEDDPSAQPEAPARFAVVSGPEAVELLLDLLDSRDSATRARAAALLHRMTGRAFGYDPTAESTEPSAEAARWRDWWNEHRGRLSWNAAAHGATTESKVPPAPQEQRLGGVVLPTVPFTAKQRRGLLASLDAWLHRPSAEALQGDSAVADRVIDYPPEPFVFEKDDEIATVLGRALKLLADRAKTASNDGREAFVILATIFRFPYSSLVPSLTALDTVIEGSESWAQARKTCSALLDWLDLRRVPVEL
jgi:hypothetical protein